MLDTSCSSIEARLEKWKLVREMIENTSSRGMVAPFALIQVPYPWPFRVKILFYLLSSACTPGLIQSIGLFQFVHTEVTF